MKRIILASISIAILAVFVDILVARSSTPARVESLLAAEQCAIHISMLDTQKLQLLILVEDPSFYENTGLDFSSPGAGFTTISQAVGKFVYFNAFRPGIRKIRLLYLTRFAMYPQVSKDTILQLFINYAYLGNANGAEIRGFEHAARIYLEKSCTELTQHEFTQLVAMLINPNEYHIRNNPQEHKERVARITKLVQGKCKPTNWRDNSLEGCN